MKQTRWTRPGKGRTLARKRKGAAISGWIVIDKAAGMTSTQVVGRVRRITGAAKLGHGGTLDPLATGILPIALGEATKVMPYIVDGLKTYRFTARWGEARTTDDAEGEVTQTSLARPTADRILSALPRFTGEVEQVPPDFSAIHVDGRRAYDLARQGRPVTLAPRVVHIKEIRLLSAAPGAEQLEQADFEMTCGKGTYVRSLVRDLGRELGCLGYLGALRRTRVGPFGESAANSLEKLEDLVHSSPPHDYLLPIETVLDDIPALTVTQSEAARLRNGQEVRVPSAKQGTVCVMAAGRPVAMGHVADGSVRPMRVFNLPAGV